MKALARFFLTTFGLLCSVAPWIAAEEPLVLHSEGRWYFPAFGVTPDRREDFGLPDYETLSRQSAWVLWPPLPYGENRSDFGVAPPAPPSRRHWLGTDDRGRDVAVRLLYGCRNSLWFAGLVAVVSLALGTLWGSAQGFIGGWLDLVGQRLTECWGSLPMLYILLLGTSIFSRSALWLGFAWIAFAWIRAATLARAEALRITNLEYILAARASGIGEHRIFWRSVLLPCARPALSLLPYAVASAVAGLSALDYLGLGLPPPQAGLGELVRQAKDNPQAWWLAVVPLLVLVVLMLALRSVGEQLRVAIDPQRAV